MLRSFLPEGLKNPLAEGQSPPQDLEVGPRSRPYLLVFVKTKIHLIEHLFKQKKNVFIGDI